MLKNGVLQTRLNELAVEKELKLLETGMHATWLLWLFVLTKRARSLEYDKIERLKPILQSQRMHMKTQQGSWVDVLSNSTKVARWIQKEDRQVLQHLVDLNVDRNIYEPRLYKISFVRAHFALLNLQAEYVWLVFVGCVSSSKKIPFSMTNRFTRSIWLKGAMGWRSVEK